MWVELYSKMKNWMSERKPNEWIIQTLQNQREMKSSYTGAYELISLLRFLESKASEEMAVSDGTIDCEGGLFSSTVQIGGPYYE